MPNLFIHPCQTGEVLQEVIDEKRNTNDHFKTSDYLPLWLSIYGKVLNLDELLALRLYM